MTNKWLEEKENKDLMNEIEVKLVVMDKDEFEFVPLRGPVMRVDWRKEQWEEELEKKLAEQREEFDESMEECLEEAYQMLIKERAKHEILDAKLKTALKCKKALERELLVAWGKIAERVVNEIKIDLEHKEKK